MRTDAHTVVEDDDALQGRTVREHTHGLVVLFLLTHKKDADLGVDYHKLYLLLTACGIKGHSNRPHAKGAEVGIQVVHGVLTEDTDVFLRFHTKIKQGVGHELHLL